MFSQFCIFSPPPTFLLMVDRICRLLQPVSDPVIPKISSSLFPWSYCFTKFRTLLCGLHWIPVVYWIPLYLYSSCSTIITLSQGSSPHICFYSRFSIISLQLTSIYSYDVIGETDFQDLRVNTSFTFMALYCSTGATSLSPC